MNEKLVKKFHFTFLALNILWPTSPTMSCSKLPFFFPSCSETAAWKSMYTELQPSRFRSFWPEKCTNVMDVGGALLVSVILRIFQNEARTSKCHFHGRISVVEERRFLPDLGSVIVACRSKLQ